MGTPPLQASRDAPAIPDGEEDSGDSARPRGSSTRLAVGKDAGQAVRQFGQNKYRQGLAAHGANVSPAAEWSISGRIHSWTGSGKELVDVN